MTEHEADVTFGYSEKLGWFINCPIFNIKLDSLPSWRLVRTIGILQSLLEAIYE